LDNLILQREGCQIAAYLAILLIVALLDSVGFTQNNNPVVEKTVEPSTNRSEDAGQTIEIEMGPLVRAPSELAQWPAWRKALASTLRQMQKRIGYDDTLYRRPEFAWVPSCYCCCFAMMYDEALYDGVKGQYSIESYLDNGVLRFGGYDAVVLWQAYPRIGFDDRNQFDFYRDMPGGLRGLRELSRAIHRRGAKVFIDYNPWDTGTRREGKSDIDALVEIVEAIEADGIFLDTLHKGTKEFRTKLDKVRPGVVLESELTLPVERIHDHHMSWAQWFTDSQVPGVLWNKWFERRHMMHQIKRWNHDHSGELHTAWMNGSGILVWENVFGSWVGWNARDCSVLRSVLPIQRRYVNLFSGEGWTPLVETEQANVYASLWEKDGLRLWTLVNRSDDLVKGVLLRVPHIEGTHYFDLITGREVGAVTSGTASVTGTIGPRGMGAFLSGKPQALGKDFNGFLARQAALYDRANFDVTFPKRTELLKPVVSSKKYRKDEIPDGMVAVDAARYEMEVKFRNRECGFYQGASLGDSTHPSHNLHEIISFKQDIRLRPFAIDLTPVTNAQFAEFIKAAGYKPEHRKNFLKHWKNSKPPAGLEDHPVVYVDLDDARAYAKWAGKRLPTEEEWQYASQGSDGRTYPWGDEWKEGLCNDGKTGGTTRVTAFPDGRSPFGCYDMCGNVWEWTESQRSDGRTRFCIIRGGSFYKAEGSHWYADGGPQPCNFAAKFILMWPGLDRCATIGFRCVVDIAEEDG
jgi:formylglycine-generating enzyme required for sulfatase activity